MVYDFFLPRARVQAQVRNPDVLWRPEGFLQDSRTDALQFGAGVREFTDALPTQSLISLSFAHQECKKYW